MTIHLTDGDLLLMEGLDCHTATSLMMDALTASLTETGDLSTRLQTPLKLQARPVSNNEKKHLLLDKTTDRKNISICTHLLGLSLFL